MTCLTSFHWGNSLSAEWKEKANKSPSMGPVTDQWNMYYTCWAEGRIEPRAIVLPPPQHSHPPRDWVYFTITISPAYQSFWLAMCFSPPFLLRISSSCQCLHIFKLFSHVSFFSIWQKISNEFPFTSLDVMIFCIQLAYTEQPTLLQLHV